MKKILSMAFIAISILSCSDTELNLQESPNSLSSSSTAASPDLLLNGIVFDMNSVHRGFSSTIDQTVRHVNQFSNYQRYLGAATLNSEWEKTYTIGKNLNLIKSIEQKSGIKYPHTPIAKIAYASCMLGLVDYIGFAVYDEANREDKPNPLAEKGDVVYPKIINLLDSAIKDLEDFANKDQGSFPDLKEPFTVNIANKEDKILHWVKFANTVKLKMYLQTRLVNSEKSKTEINKILAAGNYIMSGNQDFELKYSPTTSPTESRHPFFTNNYVSQANEIMSNGFMNRLIDKEDPRLRYYFYRQTKKKPTGGNLPCSADGVDYEFCYIGQKYWGRDHCDDIGVPSDGNFRTTYGIYPGGGAYDKYDLSNPDTAPKKASESNHLNGKGINPIMLSSFVNFMLAESVLTIGTQGDAKEYLVKGVNDSFDKVGSFYEDGAITPESKSAYITALKKEYDDADNNGKLNIIVREYHTASYGNSMESYNTYRRTGMPYDLQNPQTAPGIFPRSLFLPKTAVTRNSSISQKTLSEPVFWDTHNLAFFNDTELQE